MRLLDQSFYSRDTVTVAQNLLGKQLVRVINGQHVSGIIVETEAYCFDTDPASHAYRGVTPRTRPMFGPVGHAYVYFIYGNHFCFNIVAKKDNVLAGAVLVRALEPVLGLETMRMFRKKEDNRLLTNGPGKLTQALNINRDHNAVNLMKSDKLYVVDNGQMLFEVTTTERIGIKVGCHKLWRFYIRDNPWVSR